MMIVPIWSFSQNTSSIIITNEQLRTANLIFLEHKKYEKEVPLLKNQIQNLENINSSWEHTNNYQLKKLETYQQQIQYQNKTITNLQKSYLKKNKIIKYGTIGSCLVILTCIFLK